MGVSLYPSTAEDATSSLVADNCQMGRLVPELAIPGAYQNICMSRPERTIPLGNNNQDIVIQQGIVNGDNTATTSGNNDSGVGPGRTGVAVWNSALLLTRLLVLLSQHDKDDCDFNTNDTDTNSNNNHPSSSSSSCWIRNRTILELGCGTGLVSLACARLGAARVVATDGNPSVVALAAENVKRNAKNAPDTATTTTMKTNDHDFATVETTTLSWGLLNAMEYSDCADLVLGSDLTYNSGTWRVLGETIGTVLKPGGRFLYLTCGHSGFGVKGELDGFTQVVSSSFSLVVDTAMGTMLERELAATLSEDEKSVVESTGGVRVLVLRRKV
ncbi:Methyltransferase small domain [Fragilaria crotonensis]|nr:Methyltransferase small domain [Fragilaria crotonensis]